MRLSKLPRGRDPHFVGREELLRRLPAALRSGGARARRQALTGLGGVGKSRLAAEFACRYAEEYEIAWWVRGGQPAETAADLAALAAALELPESAEPDQRAAVAAVGRWLATNTRWLLVFDNSPGPAALREFLPAGNGHVLITSRNPHWGELAESFPVRPLPREASVAYLAVRTGEAGREAEALAELLGDLPLALAQAAAHIRQTKMPLAAYAESFRRREREWLAQGRALEDYSATVATTWELSFAAVEAASPVAADLLRVFAFLAPDDIPRSLVGEEAEPVPRPRAPAVRDPEAFIPPEPIARDLLADARAAVPQELARFRVDAGALTAAVAELERFSLVEVIADGFWVHRLVQAVVRDRLAAAARRHWAEVALALAADAFPAESKDVLTWPRCSRLLPHALAAAEHAEAFGVAPAAAARILGRAGVYLAARALYSEAAALQGRALTLAEAAFGREHPNVAEVLTNLGNLDSTLGRLDSARADYERALRIVEAALPARHPLVAVCLNNVGAVRRSLGDLAGARAAFERALAIDEAAYGPAHPEVATDWNNLGGTLAELGEADRAQACFERALAIDEAAYGPAHPRVATRLTNLGRLFDRRGEPARARENLERALRIDEAAYGAAHPAVAFDLIQLGEFSERRDNCAAARKYYERALGILRARLGPDHPTAKALEARLASLATET